MNGETILCLRCGREFARPEDGSFQCDDCLRVRDHTPWNVARTERITYGERDWRPGEAFIQWKGTDVCFDFICTCGSQGHFDGYFAYAFRCPDCGQRWEFPFNVTALAVGGDGQPSPTAHEPVTLDMDEP